MDWGVAKLTGQSLVSLGDASVGQAPASESPTTGHGVVLGTPGYMAPEQASGDPGLVDARADVYAIGAILRDLCAVETPDGDARPRQNELPRSLRAIIAKAMSHDPAHRYPDVMSLARDVGAFSAGEPVTAYRENLLERGRRLARRYRTPILLVLAYLLMRITLLAVVGR
jgi:eukaryotic-like serine/threonine-protein kinase